MEDSSIPMPLPGAFLTPSPILPEDFTGSTTFEDSSRIVENEVFPQKMNTHSLLRYHSSIPKHLHLMSSERLHEGSSSPNFSQSSLLYDLEGEFQPLLSARSLYSRKWKKVTLFTQPFTTLRYFFAMAISFFGAFVRYFQRSWRLYGIMVFLLISLVLTSYFEGPHAFLVNEILQYFELVVWWCGLGILSSIGLGTGMHSGLLFLFPHVFLICITAEKCNSLQFDARSNMWYNVRQPWDALECLRQEPLESFANNVTAVGLLMKILPYGFLWGIGSAIGELPPYAASYAAAKAREADDDYEELTLEMFSNKKDIFSRMKYMMILLLKKYGALSVILLSSYPNVFFDICGMLCGHFKMPFWHFFLALCLGKGIIKIIGQCSFCVFLFSARFHEARTHILAVLSGLWPVSAIAAFYFGSVEEFQRYILEEIRKLREGVQNRGSSKSEGALCYFSTAFTIFMVGILSFFIISCINQCAQVYQKKLVLLASSKSGSSSGSLAKEMQCFPYDTNTQCGGAEEEVGMATVKAGGEASKISALKRKII